MIRGLRQAGVIGALDEHFARALGRVSGERNEAVLAAAALVSRLSASGHVCFDLAAAGPEALPLELGAAEELGLPAPQRWRALLQDSPLVTDEAASQRCPLVLDDSGRLYLYRLWRHEQTLAEHLRQRVAAPPSEVDPALLGDGLQRLFGPPLGDAARPGDGQRLAALLAATRSLCVITGGPGTGKTSTVVKILALLCEQAFAQKQRFSFALLAPTGKAAARLSASIREARERLDCAPEVRDALPDEAMTVHRRLGVRPGAASARYHADNPLPTDGVLVDEASMVDLALMSRLVEAVPSSARLILMGDREQLASVAPGSVLADICNGGQTPGYSTPLQERLADQTGDRVGQGTVGPATSGIWDCLAHLTHSFRFGADSGIGALGRAVIAGDADAALDVLEDDRYPDVVRLDPGGDGAPDTVVQQAVAAYEPFARAKDPGARLAALSRFRVLCAHRQGPQGVHRLNGAVEQGLAQAGWLTPDERHYAGRPVLVTENSYGLGLFNGDVGVIHPGPDGTRRAHFVDPDGRSRSFAPSRLPAHETVFAMTVHKSQGSEFDEVVLLLPEALSRVVTVELVYTAVTRARRAVWLCASEETLRRALSHRAERSSGLRDQLWSPIP